MGCKDWTWGVGGGGEWWSDEVSQETRGGLGWLREGAALGREEGGVSAGAEFLLGGRGYQRVEG